MFAFYTNLYRDCLLRKKSGGNFQQQMFSNCIFSYKVIYLLIKKNRLKIFDIDSCLLRNKFMCFAL